MTGSAWKEIGREMYRMIRPALRRWLRRCRDAVADAGTRQEVLSSGSAVPKPQVSNPARERTEPYTEAIARFVETAGNDEPGRGEIRLGSGILNGSTEERS
jgi:hypothetical protein